MNVLNDRSSIQLFFFITVNENRIIICCQLAMMSAKNLPPKKPHTDDLSFVLDKIQNVNSI